jgi:hypothetical protein
MEDATATHYFSGADIRKSASKRNTLFALLSWNISP